ncbi:MAG TPA: hypothetical protein VN654_05250 [Vicinamibacterales bacterium]|nr:hypothetical protein [Vicinamibacterales bacterium]
MAELKPKDYRVVLRHPRRDQPMGDITAADGRVLASAGETCEGLSPEELQSALRNGYVEPVPKKGKR